MKIACYIRIFTRKKSEHKELALVVAQKNPSNHHLLMKDSVILNCIVHRSYKFYALILPKILCVCGCVCLHVLFKGQ